jgi:very-short-patch-repair endonuclease
MKYVKALHFARDMRKNPTQAEDLFWQHVRRRKLFSLKFNRQYVIQHAVINNEAHYFIVDFICLEHRLIIEIDGSIHDAQRDYDATREKILNEMGFVILRFSNKDVLDRVSFIEDRIALYLFTHP